MEEFIIPVSREDLSKRSSEHQYYVSKLVNKDSLPKHIAVCEQEFRERGHLFIYGMFDYLFSVIYQWDCVDMKIKEKSWDLLLKSCQKCTPKIIEVLNNNVSRDDQFKYRNCIKMNIYLLCQMIELFENEIRLVNTVINEKGKGSKKKKTVATKMDLFDEIEMAINGISQLFQCKITQFWDPPIVEDDFVNLITNTCYKLLGNPDFCKNTKNREAISKILIVMIRNYNHNATCPLKLVQLLRDSPHMPSHLVYICRQFLNSENFPSTVRDILTEICSVSSIDLERNNQASSSFSSFLTDLSAEFPDSVVPILSHLKNKLDEDPYNMRNCVLSVLGEVVVQIYSRSHENAANRDSLIELIEDHVSDVNGFVRAKALSILLSIVEKCTLPLCRLARIMKLLVGENGAIFDSSSIARKNAMRIITTIVDLNVPKGLSYKELKEKQDAEKLVMEELEKKIAEMPTENVADIEKQIEFLKEKIENGDQGTIPTAPLESQSVAKEMLEKKLGEVKGVIYILGQMMEITSLIECGLNNIQCMLSSRVVSDVLEAISFFVKAKLSNLLNVDSKIRKMLPHICSKDESIRAAITNAYKMLYLDVDEEDNDKIQMIVDSLSNLVTNPTFGELSCAEKLMINFTESGDIDQSIIQCMWDRFRCQNNTYTPTQKKNAVILFSMVANVPKPFMSKYFDALIKEGIPTSGFDTLDLQVIEYICITIQNLAKARKPGKMEEAHRYPRSHQLFERLLKLCNVTFPMAHKYCWIPMTNEALNTIYLLAETPNIISIMFISQIANKIFSLYDQKSENNTFCSPRFMLTRFVDVAGHVALKQFIHFDGSILAELKRRNVILEEKDQLKKTKKLAKDRRRQTASNDKDSTQNLEEEMGLVGATADDAEAEFIRKLCENELITNPSKLLYRLLNLVIYICSNASRFKDKDLQKIATLSLGKMMLISSKVCMDNIDLLFNSAVRSPSEIIRGNLIVPLGDLIKRFTTKLEPYTPSLYGRLRDSSPFVRLNALNVLSHLILNDMIKVKGQLSEMTTCIIDDNPRIVHLSKIFFQELANKDKALYNVMPDIISRLSNPETGVSEEKFRTIMEYLLPFIQKKNQTENLFEKISARFQASNDERSWRDLSYCLSLMPFNETMLRALQFTLGNFAGKLHIDEVNDAISGIINNAKKTAKGDMVGIIEEMSSSLAKLREQGVEDEEANVNAQRAQVKKKQRKSKKQRETIIGNNAESEPTSTQATENSVRKSTRRPNKTKKEDNSDDSMDDNQSIASSRQPRSCRPKLNNLRNVFSSDESSSDESRTDKVTTKRNETLKRNIKEESESESESD